MTSHSSSGYRMVVNRDVMIPMRDGVKLATDIYQPTFGIGLSSGAFPVILQRTIYDKSADYTALPAKYFSRRGYVSVVQDCRGRFNSEGDYYHMINESEDGFDTLEWLSTQPWCNGKIGMWGGSYLSQVQSAAATQSPKHLSAMVPMYGPTNIYSYGLRHDGAFQLKFLAAALWLASDSKEARSNPTIGERLINFRLYDLFEDLPLKLGQSILSLVPAYERWILDFMNKTDYDDFWCNPSFNIEAHLTEHSDVPVFLVGGWYDSWSRATVTHFSDLSKTKSGPIKLLMGPWTHGGHSNTNSGDVDFGPESRLDGNLAENFNEWLKSWFDYTLRGLENEMSSSPAVKLFVMGGGSGKKTPAGRLDHGGSWRDEQEWPLPQTLYTNYYIHGNGTLSRSTSSVNESSTSYIFDPDNPVPTVGGNLSGLSERIPPNEMIEGQILNRRPIIMPGAIHQSTREGSFGAKTPYGPLCDRPDVIVFQTPVLCDNIEVIGPITVRLWISSTASDTDFTAKLLDIYPPSSDYPDGYHMNICEGIQRARYREGYGKSELLEPGRVYELEIILEPTANLFTVGHRIRLDVSSSNFPRFDVNPNTGESLGRNTYRIKTTNTLYHDSLHPSHISLPIIPV